MFRDKEIVKVFGKDCEITVIENEKGVCWAEGYYDKHYIRGQSAKTRKKAIENWKRKPEYATDF